MKTRNYGIFSVVIFAMFGCFGLGLVSAQGNKTTVVYDSFEKPGGYTLADYSAKWDNIYGLGEMDPSVGPDTRSFAGGQFTITAVPFKTAADFSVYDHLKYIGVSHQSFPAPVKGSLSFSAEIEAQTPGTQPGRVIRGTYMQSGLPYAKATLEGQQAGVVLNMINFKTGQLFDWFIAGHTAFTLIERLPTVVTGSPGVGRDKMYTQIIKEMPISPGKHTVEIVYTRKPNKDEVEYYLDGKLISKIGDVGIPLDKQGVDFTGTYPSLGPGSLVKDDIDSFVIGHGLFSLVDEFPFQHPEAPELWVNIPVANRIFGQGAVGKFDNFIVTTKKD